MAGPYSIKIPYMEWVDARYRNRMVEWTKTAVICRPRHVLPSTFGSAATIVCLADLLSVRIRQ